MQQAETQIKKERTPFAGVHKCKPLCPPRTEGLVLYSVDRRRACS